MNHSIYSLVYTSSQTSLGLSKKLIGKKNPVIFFQDMNDLPKVRSSKQYYVFWVIESASYYKASYPSVDIHELNGVFNWTMTFRKNSDIFLPYGRIVQIKDHPPPGPD